MSEYDITNGPRLVGYQLASQTYGYVMRTLELGAVVGPIGKMEINPALKPVIEALNIVLAGGEVKFDVLQRGNPDIINELNRRLAAGMVEANTINEKAGYYVTVMG